MTTISYQKGQNTIANPVGPQLAGNGIAGLGGGLNPKELIEAALGLCISLTLTKLLERDGKLTTDTELAVRVTSEKDPGGENRLGRFDIQLTLPPWVDTEYGDKLMLMAERGCTIGNTVRHGADVEIKRV